MSAFQPVAKANPCSVCQGDHKCSRGADGLLVCGRRSDAQPGIVHLGPAKDPTAWPTTSVCPARPSTASSPSAARAGPGPSAKWTAAIASSASNSATATARAA